MGKKRITDDGEIVDEMQSLANNPQLPLPSPVLGPQWKTGYNCDNLEEANRSATWNTEPSLTQVHAAEETDINVIMRKFGVTGTLPLAKVPPSFQDIQEIDLQTAQNLINEAEDAFMELPADLRFKFNNDLARYVGYVDDRRAANDWKSLRDLGLDVPEPPPPPETPPAKGATKD